VSRSTVGIRHAAPAAYVDRAGDAEETPGAAGSLDTPRKYAVSGPREDLIGRIDKQIEVTPGEFHAAG
jgi:hypothetical protein